MATDRTMPLLTSNVPEVRAWAWRLEMEYQADQGPMVMNLEGRLRIGTPIAEREPALAKSSAAERLAFAAGIRRIEPSKRHHYLAVLLRCIRAEDATDANLPLETWYAVEPSIGFDLQQYLG